MMYLVNKTKLEYTSKLSPLLSRAASARLPESFLGNEVCVYGLEDKWEEDIQK